MRKGKCLECGCETISTRKPKLFCCPAHQVAHTNRRRERGAVIYDLFMAMRYERKLSAKLKVWGTMCQQAAEWRREDFAGRDGRPSWGNWREWLEKNGARLGAKLVASGGRHNWNGLRKAPKPESTLGDWTK